MAECGKSYKKVIQELVDENIDPETFVVIVSLGMFLNISILVIKARIAEITRTQRRRVTHWEATEWFCTKMMRLWINHSFRSYCVFNGIKFLAPRVYRVDLTRSVTQCREHFEETMGLAIEIIDIVPPLEFFSAYNIIMKNLEAADSLSTQATIALPDESTAPRIPPTQASSSSSRKRSATVSSSECAAGGPEEVYDRPIKKLKSTKLWHNQYPCGVECTDRDDLNNHIGEVYSTEHWACSYPEVPSRSITELNTSKPSTGTVQN